MSEAETRLEQAEAEYLRAKQEHQDARREYAEACKSGTDREREEKKTARYAAYVKAKDAHAAYLKLKES
jgi:hypothetical protein